MNIHELEARLRAHLGQPGWEDAMASEHRAADWGAVARLVADIRREADLIGTVPEKYPRHVSLVIRFVHALLPWYTRPLRAFGGNCAEAFEGLFDQVSELARNQSKILGRLDTLERNLPEQRRRVSGSDR